jgi:hypothetical protein
MARHTKWFMAACAVAMLSAPAPAGAAASKRENEIVDTTFVSETGHIKMYRMVALMPGDDRRVKCHKGWVPESRVVYRVTGDDHIEKVTDRYISLYGILWARPGTATTRVHVYWDRGRNLVTNTGGGYVAFQLTCREVGR